jgi:hypothetical protein
MGRGMWRMRPYAANICGLKLLRPYAANICGLKQAGNGERHAEEQEEEEARAEGGALAVSKGALVAKGIGRVEGETTERACDTERMREKERARAREREKEGRRIAKSFLYHISMHREKYQVNPKFTRFTCTLLLTTKSTIATCQDFADAVCLL